MTSEKSRSYRFPIVVGFFVTLGTLILVLAIFILGGQRGTFLRTKLVHARFTDIGGLKKGDNVWFAGVKIGMIRYIRIEGKHKVLVTFGIDASVDSLIRKDSRVRISSDGIMGNRIVVIYGGSNQEKNLAESDVIEADVYADPQELFRTLGNSSHDLADLASNLKEISNEILNGPGSISRLLNDSMLSNSIAQTGAGLHRAIDRLEITASRTGRLVESLQESAQRLHEPGNLAYELLEDTTFYHNLMASSEHLKTGLAGLADFSKSLENCKVALSGQRGIAGTLLYDSLSAVHLKSTLTNLDSASRVLETDLRALQHSLLLRRYFRKQERKRRQ